MRWKIDSNWSSIDGNNDDHDADDDDDTDVDDDADVDDDSGDDESDKGEGEK